MQVVEKIHTSVQKLPESFQAEVLHFVEYLLFKSERETAPQGDIDWSSFSLNAAMQGMEDEETPAYSMDDLKVTFS